MFWLCIALMLIGFILDLELPECITLHYTTYNKRLFNSNSLALSVVLVRDLYPPGWREKTPSTIC